MNNPADRIHSESFADWWSKNTRCQPVGYLAVEALAAEAFAAGQAHMRGIVEMLAVRRAKDGDTCWCREELPPHEDGKPHHEQCCNAARVAISGIAEE